MQKEQICEQSKKKKEKLLVNFYQALQFQVMFSEQDNTNRNLGRMINFRPKEQSILVEQKIFQGFGGCCKFTKKKIGQN